MKRFFMILLMIIVATSVFGQATSVKKIKVGISMSSADEFNTNLLAKYQALAKEFGVTLVTTNANSTVSKQLSDVESLIAQKCDVIVIRGVDPDGAVPACEMVKAAGIPLVIDETRVNTEIYDARVTSDQITHGRLLGGYLKQWLAADPKRVANVGYIIGISSPNILRRRDGIFEVCPQAKLVAEAVADWQADKAMRVVEDWLLAYPQINVIAAANDEMAIGAIQALKATGKNFKDYLVFGVDGTQNGQAYIRSGELDATTYQDIGKSSRMVMEVAIGLVNGQKYPKIIDAQIISLMTKDTIDALVGKK